MYVRASKSKDILVLFIPVFFPEASHRGHRRKQEGSEEYPLFMQETMQTLRPPTIAL
jgi:hypothetical protein